MTDRSALEAERDFLLDSIRRLDEDKASGVLTDQEYIDLRDEQTVRAARVLEELDIEEKPALAKSAAPSKPVRTSEQRKRTVWLVGLGAFALLAVVGVVSAASGRLAGDSTTGSLNADSNTLLQRAQQQSAKGNAADAVKTYDAILKQDPQNFQALTYRGWLIRLAGLTDQGLTSINQAIATNPAYPDAHFFKGFILFRDKQDPKAAVTEFKAFLADNPPKDMVPLVQQTLQDAEAEAAVQK